MSEEEGGLSHHRSEVEAVLLRDQVRRMVYRRASIEEICEECKITSANANKIITTEMAQAKARRVNDQGAILEVEIGAARERLNAIEAELRKHPHKAKLYGPWDRVQARYLALQGIHVERPAQALQLNVFNGGQGRDLTGVETAELRRLVSGAVADGQAPEYMLEGLEEVIEGEEVQ